MKKYLSILIAFTLILTSCVTYKADSDYASYPDYNQRVNVTGAHYDGVLNPLGVTSIAASTVAGGYLGYQSNLIKYNSGTEQVTSKIGNAAIGAVVGFGASYFLNRLLGWGKTKSVTNTSEWIQKANKNFLLVSGYSGNFTVIPKDADRNYSIQNIQDGRDFTQVFSGSSYSDKTFNTGVYNLSRNDLPSLITLFPNTQSLSLAKNKYITTSPSYSEIVKATQLYPDLKNDYEKNFLSLVSVYDNAADFKSRFPKPSSSSFDQIVIRLTPKLNRDELPKLITLFEQEPSVSKTKEEYIKSSNTIDDFFSAIKKYPATDIKINFGFYRNSLNNARVVYNDLLSIKTKLGDMNFKRISNNLADESMKSLFYENNTKQDYQNYIYDISNEGWMSSSSSKYIQLAQNEIIKIEKTENDNIRRNEYLNAKSAGISSLVSFANKYSNSQEAGEAKKELDTYVENNVVQAMDPFNWVAPGDRSFWGAWAENNRSWWKGSKNYNIFYLGRLKNTSSNTLNLKLTINLNLKISTNLLIFFGGVSNITETQNYYLTLKPNESKPYIVLFDNISGGTQLGLVYGKKIEFDDTPFNFKMEYCNENISEDILQTQQNLVDNVIKFKGNIETKNWGGSSINELLASAGGDNDYGTLIVTYKSQYNNPSLTIYDSRGEIIKTDSWKDSGSNTGTYSLPKNESYTIEVSECNKKYTVNLDVRKMTFVIDKNCSSNTIKERD